MRMAVARICFPRFGEQNDSLYIGHAIDKRKIFLVF